MYSERLSMQFSKNIKLMIMSKVTKTQGFTLSLKDTFSEKSQRRGQIDDQGRFRVKLLSDKFVSKSILHAHK